MKIWYAVFCKARLEAVAEENLRRQGFDVYLPRISIAHRRRGKLVEQIDPLFPRYLFIHLDTTRQSASVVRSTRGAIDVVRYGDQLATVPDEVMHLIRSQEDVAREMCRSGQAIFNTGAPIKIVDGAFAGVEGVFDGQDGEGRVFVLLEMLGKVNSVRVNRDWVIQAA